MQLALKHTLAVCVLVLCIIPFNSAGQEPETKPHSKVWDGNFSTFIFHSDSPGIIHTASVGTTIRRKHRFDIGLFIPLKIKGAGIGYTYFPNATDNRFNLLFSYNAFYALSETSFYDPHTRPNMGLPERYKVINAIGTGFLTNVTSNLYINLNANSAFTYLKDYGLEMALFMRLGLGYNFTKKY